MDEAIYHQQASIELSEIFTLIEELDVNDLLETDLLDSESVLSIILPNDKEYVINKHNASKKIWVSSPISGVSYYFYNENLKDWLNKDNLSLRSLLINELTNFLKSNQE